MDYQRKLLLIELRAAVASMEMVESLMEHDIKRLSEWSEDHRAHWQHYRENYDKTLSRLKQLDGGQDPLLTTVTTTR